MWQIMYKSLILIGVITLTACASASRLLNPFDNEVKEQPSTPQNATLYLCEGNQKFYVRMLNSNNDAWLIYPDHEVNLPRSSVDKNRYASGAITLVFNGDQTTLIDGERIAYTGCKAQPQK